MTSFRSSELTELPVVENSQLFAQRVHSARYAPILWYGSCTYEPHGRTGSTRNSEQRTYGWLANKRYATSIDVVPTKCNSEETLAKRLKGVTHTDAHTQSMEGTCSLTTNQPVKINVPVADEPHQYPPP